jgi:hypothetical protein
LLQCDVSGQALKRLLRTPCALKFLSLRMPPNGMGFSQ